MLSIKKHAANVKRVVSGFSLLEMLIALSLGSVILFAASRLFSNIYLAQYQQQERFKLQKNAHQMLNYLQQQILHTGYQGANRENSNFDWFKANGRAYLLEPNCLIILQDLNGDGCVGKRARTCTQNELSTTKEIPKEITAVKLENGGLMVAGKQNKFTPCHQGECAKWLQRCSNMQWEKIAAQTDNQIEKLHFSWEKPHRLIKIDLTLSSLKNRSTQYSATAYAYLLNGE